ncbi:hypothetical protein D3C84_996730 [compost metagenome]
MTGPDDVRYICIIYTCFVIGNNTLEITDDLGYHVLLLEQKKIPGHRLRKQGGAATGSGSAGILKGGVNLSIS